ncbi:MAG: hypothetical protein R2762_06510 [Bryobacteraceae bacterium]
MAFRNSACMVTVGGSQMQLLSNHQWVAGAVKAAIWALLALAVLEVCRKPLH